MAYRYNDIEIAACGGRQSMDEVYVHASQKPEDHASCGIIGNDFFLQFNTAVLNLDKMYLYFID